MRRSYSREASTPPAAGPAGPAAEPLLAQDIASGRVGPRDVGVDLSPTSRSEYLDKKPWWNIRGFWEYVAERNRRIGVKISQRKLRSSGKPNQPPTTTVTLPTSKPRDQEHTAPPKHIDDATSRHDDLVTKSQNSPSPQDISHTDALIHENSERRTREALMMDRSAPVTDASGDSSVTPDESRLQEATTSTGALSVRTSISDMQSTTMAIGDRQAEPNLIADTTPGCGSLRANPDKLWAWEAVMIKNGKGDLQSVKLFFDTGTHDNLASKNFAEGRKLELRLILPEDMQVYRTPNGSLYPTQYIELWLKDDIHGMQDFAKVRFIIVEDLGGIEMIAGSDFMEEHGIILDPTKPRGMFPAVAGKASAGTLRFVNSRG